MPDLASAFAAASIGAMLFFSAAVAPTVFQALPAEQAGAFLRALFPRYFLINGIAGVVAAALAFRPLPGALLLIGGAALIALRFAVVPAINKAPRRNARGRRLGAAGLRPLASPVGRRQCRGDGAVRRRRLASAGPGGVRRHSIRRSRSARGASCFRPVMIPNAASPVTRRYHHGGDHEQPQDLSRLDHRRACRAGPAGAGVRVQSLQCRHHRQGDCLRQAGDRPCLCAMVPAMPRAGGDP